MAKYSTFNATNKLGSNRIFNERLKYEIGLVDETDTIPKPMIKFFIGEFQFYGKVDEDLNPVIAKTNKLKMISDKNNLLVLDFVQKQFNALKQTFVKCVNIGTISKTDPYLSVLIPEKAYESTDAAYKGYMGKVMESFNKEYIINGRRINKVENFIDYTNLLIEYSKLTSNILPITKTSFVKTNFCPMSVSGLVIELTKLKYSNDSDKFKFASSPNFEFFKKACIKHGFSIDYNAPWRIIADIDSPPMVEAMEKMGYNRETIFVSHFDQTSDTEIENIKTVLYNGYSTLVKSNSVSKIVVECKNSLKSKFINREVISRATLNKILDNSSALQIYATIRNSEQEKSLSSQSIQKISSNAKSILSAYDILKAVKFVEQELRPNQLAGSGTLNTIVLSSKERTKG
jgi:hypothetical protein